MKLSFKFKMVFVILPLVIIGLLSLTAVAYVEFKNAIETELIDSMERTTSETANHINTWLSGRLGEVRQTVESPMVKRILELNPQLDLRRGDDDESIKMIDEINLARWKYLNEAYPGQYAALHIINFVEPVEWSDPTTHNKLLARYYNVKEGKCKTDPWALGAKAGAGERFSQTGGVPYDFINKPTHSQAYNKDVVLMLAWRKDSQGRTIAGAAAGITIETIQQLAQQLKYGEKGYGILLAHDGTFAVHPNPEWAMKKKISEVKGEEIYKLAELVANGGSGIFRYSDGIDKKIAFYNPVPVAGWTVIRVVYEDELFTRVHNLLIIMLSITAMIITMLLPMIYHASRRLSEPLEHLSKFAEQVAGGDLSASIQVESHDEIGKLADSINNTVRTLRVKEELQITLQKLQEEITERERVEEALDAANQELTAANEELTAMNEELSAMNEEVLNTNDGLEKEVVERQRVEQQLIQAMDKTKAMHVHMIQSEKMAALGSLVAGVAHEVNTPIGVSLTASSHLKQVTEEFLDLCQHGAPLRKDLVDYLENLQESSTIILNNLERAGKLIQSFKRVSVDQSSEIQRIFNVKKYLEEILLSLHPRIKKTKHHITVECDDEININGFAGAFAQVITNLIMNSLIHAYDPEDEGNIRIAVQKETGWLFVDYSDDGKGMDSNILPKIFDPFFTTTRGSGGTGLGLYVVYNIVTQQFDGTIECDSTLGKGMTFRIRLAIGEEQENANNM